MALACCGCSGEALGERVVGDAVVSELICDFMYSASYNLIYEVGMPIPCFLERQFVRFLQFFLCITEMLLKIDPCVFNRWVLIPKFNIFTKDSTAVENIIGFHNNLML